MLAPYIVTLGVLAGLAGIWHQVRLVFFEIDQ